MEVFNGRKVFSEIGYPKVGYIYYTISCSEVTELNGKVQFSSKVHFFGEL